MKHKDLTSPGGPVAPHAGAWIETHGQLGYIGRIHAPPMRLRGLNKVVYTIRRRMSPPGGVDETACGTRWHQVPPVAPHWGAG